MLLWIFISLNNALKSIFYPYPENTISFAVTLRLIMLANLNI